MKTLFYAIVTSVIAGIIVIIIQEQRNKAKS